MGTIAILGIALIITLMLGVVTFAYKAPYDPRKDDQPRPSPSCGQSIVAGHGRFFAWMCRCMIGSVTRVRTGLERPCRP
jgi:hypothetical protein